MHHRPMDYLNRLGGPLQAIEIAAAKIVQALNSPFVAVQMRLQRDYMGETRVLLPWVPFAVLQGVLFRSFLGSL
jgi:hypothetical protein